MTTEEKTELQEHGEAAGTDGNASEQRTFTQKEFDAKFRARYKREQDKHERQIAELEERHAQEIAQLRETLTANVERAQHLEHDKRQVDKHREELEELRAYKAERERNDMLQRVSSKYGGVPIDLLRGDTEEELHACAEKIRAYADTFKPEVPTVRAAGATPAPDSVASIYNGTKDRRERIEKIAEHRAMYG